jgi:hypothetical protein
LSIFAIDSDRVFVICRSSSSKLTRPRLVRRPNMCVTIVSDKKAGRLAAVNSDVTCATHGRPRLADDLRRTERLAVRLPGDLGLCLRSRASAEDETLTAVVEGLLRRALEAAEL